MIIEKTHPCSDAQSVYDKLIGVNHQKDQLLSNLNLIFNNKEVEKWQKKNHNNQNLGILKMIELRAPLIILSGEVGCGKTALANSVSTPLSRTLGKKIICMETPSDIRGTGLVGELSNRISAAFKAAKQKVTRNGYGILIIDEADDLATSRSQNQAHHEDRAGLNVLIKQIDQIKQEGINLAVILVTNRLNVLDPAIRRRAMICLNFTRPNKEARRLVFEAMLEGTNFQKGKIEELVALSDRVDNPYSYSDLIEKIGQKALLSAVTENKPFNSCYIENAINSIEPTPMLN